MSSISIGTQFLYLSNLNAQQTRSCTTVADFLLEQDLSANYYMIDKVQQIEVNEFMDK